jgi:hypothetical protein
MTVVSPRLSRSATMISRSWNATVLAVWSSSPAPTTPRSVSLDTISLGAKCSPAHVDLPEPLGPTSTTRLGAGRRNSIALFSSIALF